MKKTLCILCALIMLVTVLGINLSAIGEQNIFDFHTQIQKDYINDDLENVHDYVTGEEENSRPVPLILDFSQDGIAESDKYIVQISGTADFSDCRTLNNVDNNFFELYNLKLGEHLFWRAGTDKNSIEKSPVHGVTVTEQGPRNCFVDGVTNVRDIGGYKSSLVENGCIRQGLYYRGANLNDITEEGKRQLTDELGVAAEIDLRDKDQCQGPYVEGVEYYSFPIPSGTENVRFETFDNEYYGIFTVISNADKAPVYLHCTAGADRTGISTFMLLTVCGADYDDIARDYLFTNFSTHGARYIENEFVKWWTKLDKFFGDTMAENAAGWMMSKGIEEKKIERIREIFVDGYISDIDRELKYEVVADKSDASGNISFCSNADPKSFVGVKLDGRSLFDREYNYDKETGIITLSEKLEAGREYKLAVVSEDGIGELTFTCKESSNLLIVLACIVAAVVIITVAAVLLVNKAKKNKNGN